MTLPRILISAMLSVFAVACSPDQASTSSGSATGGFASAAGVSAAKNAAFQAVRRYTSFSGLSPASYTERLVKAEDGRTKVELLELNGKPLSSLPTQQEIDAFLTMKAMLEGGAGKFAATIRDFSVRDVGPFLQNYTYSVILPEAMVAGRSCVVLEVRPIHPDRPNYWVWADAEHFTTLKYVERLPNGAVAAEMECQQVDFAFNTKHEVFPNSAASPPIDVSSTSLSGVVPFKVFEPSYLPQGFVLDGIKFATIAARPVLNWTYTDGVQEINISQYAEIGIPEIAPPDSYPANAPVHVRINVTGALVATSFVIDGTQIHVKAKVEPDELMTIVESLSPKGP